MLEGGVEDYVGRGLGEVRGNGPRNRPRAHTQNIVDLEVLNEVSLT